MKLENAGEISVDHRTLAESYRLGSVPARMKSLTEIQHLIDTEDSYEARVGDTDAKVYVWFELAARATAGVWTFNHLTPVALDEKSWAALLHEAVSRHSGRRFTSRIVQTYSRDQSARRAACEALSWRKEGELPRYYRIAGEFIDAEQWALVGGGHA